MSLKSFTFQDFLRLEYQNQFTVSGNATLNDPERMYFLTEVVSNGLWTLHIKGNNADQTLRNYDRTGTGVKQFLRPICASEVSFTGVTEVSGFWTYATKVSH
ncbi:hypothetical protein [Leptospira kmetyi]|uniref:Uncharacterized protein n=1 Tax=Leptospira kmetyi TaxID=408139 RepID=A0ABX4N6T8_9LEPT|nr:hypothetical protein [Leptospira kmetyi]PJZ29107.1 hypothetical protein CH378_14570 [Leptospira kmetyi]PJZ39726.1 hypothetical protein CH370_19945 [Leptospira kmetyi]